MSDSAPVLSTVRKRKTENTNSTRRLIIKDSLEMLKGEPKRKHIKVGPVNLCKPSRNEKHPPELRCILEFLTKHYPIISTFDTDNPLVLYFKVYHLTGIFIKYLKNSAYKPSKTSMFNFYDICGCRRCIREYIMEHYPSISPSSY